MLTPADFWGYVIAGQTAQARLFDADGQSDNVENSFGSLQSQVAALTTKVNQILDILNES